MKKVMIAAGGTGGHIFPAIALAKKLFDSGNDILFVGGGLTNNRFFDKQQFAFKEVACGPFTKSPLKALSSLAKISKGTWSSSAIIKSYKPDCLVGFGSYYTFPTLLAAKSANIPIILHEANAIPGQVNKLFSKYAAMTGIHMPVTAQFLKGLTQEVVMPLREGFKRGLHETAEARRYFDLDPHRLTFLVFGGSQGASSINRTFSQVIVNHLPLPREQFQILHFAGDHAFADEARALYQLNGIKACVKNFEPRMDLAWSSTDLVISRAGASTITEVLEFEVPSILIPYPYAKDNHQEYNADFIVDEVHGGIKLLESQLTPTELCSRLIELLANDRQCLRDMKQAINLYKQTQKKCDFSTLVMELMNSYE